MIEKLRLKFVEKHHIKTASTKGIEELACQIGISKNTLRRFLGKIQSETKLSNVSLNLISIYLGYKNYKEFTDFDHDNSSIDLLTLSLLFDSIKNKGVVINEKKYKDINRQFAEKIILNNKNLKQFLTTFANNKEALEYVLAWHPTYVKISDIEYQNVLKWYAANSKISHINVFVNSFIFFGKFISNSLNIEDYKLILKAEKEVLKMRNEYDFFWAFPEARFAIAKTLFLYHTESPDLENFIDETIYYFEKNAVENHDKSIFISYYSNALNLIEKYDLAHSLQTKYIDLQFLSSENYYHSYSQLPIYTICNATTLYNVGEIQKAKEIYDELKKQNLENLPFDIKEYVQIQFYLLGYYLNKKDRLHLNKIDEIITKTNFQFYKKFL